jgi:hypothetical protein
VAGNEERAVLCYSAAAALSDPHGMVLLGRCKWAGAGCAQDKEGARKLIEEGLELLHARVKSNQGDHPFLVHSEMHSNTPCRCGHCCSCCCLLLLLEIMDCNANHLLRWLGRGKSGSVTSAYAEQPNLMQLNGTIFTTLLCCMLPRREVH